MKVTQSRIETTSIKIIKNYQSHDFKNLSIFFRAPYPKRNQFPGRSKLSCAKRKYLITPNHSSRIPQVPKRDWVRCYNSTSLPYAYTTQSIKIPHEITVKSALKPLGRFLRLGQESGAMKPGESNGAAFHKDWKEDSSAISCARTNASDGEQFRDARAGQLINQSNNVEDGAKTGAAS